MLRCILKVYEIPAPWITSCSWPVGLVIVLDSGPLGLLVYPRGLPEVDGCDHRLESLIATGHRVVLPEIRDDEVRRELLRLDLGRGLDRLDTLKTLLEYVPLSTDAMVEAAELWADARRHGRPTADPKALDIDVILAAQARLLTAPQDQAVVATANVGHLARFVEARR